MQTETTPKQTTRCQCPHCGVVLETNDPVAGMRVNCPKCGSEFVATPIKTASHTFAGGKAANPAKPKRKIWLWVIVVVLIICLVGSCYINERQALYREQQEREFLLQQQEQARQHELMLQREQNEHEKEHDKHETNKILVGGAVAAGLAILGALLGSGNAGSNGY